MKRLSSIFALVLILLGSACEQDKKEDKYKIRGRILESCDNPEPVEGVHVGLQLDKPVTTFNSEGAEYLDRVLTGPNGEFVLSYDEDIHSNIYIKRLRDRNESPDLMMMGLPHNRDLDVGNLYYNGAEVDASFTLETPYPFSAQDTLVLKGILGHIDVSPIEPRYLVGPFTDGELVVFRKGVSSSTQTYFPDSTIFSDHYGLIDPDFTLAHHYFFKGHAKSKRAVIYYINSCQEREIKIRLDSTMLGE